MIQINEVYGQFVVAGFAPGRTKRGRRIVIVRCNLCQTEVSIGVDRWRTKQLRNQKMKCMGCRKVKFDAACRTPLTLTDEEAKHILASARTVVFRALPLQEALANWEETVGETMIELFSRGAAAKDHNLDRVAYSIAFRRAKRVWNKPAARFAEQTLGGDGEWLDPFDIAVDLREPEPTEVGIAAGRSLFTQRGRARMASFVSGLQSTLECGSSAHCVTEFPLSGSVRRYFSGGCPCLATMLGRSLRKELRRKSASALNVKLNDSGLNARHESARHGNAAFHLPTSATTMPA